MDTPFPIPFHLVGRFVEPLNDHIKDATAQNKAVNIVFVWIDGMPLQIRVDTGDDIIAHDHPTDEFGRRMQVLNKRHDPRYCVPLIMTRVNTCQTLAWAYRLPWAEPPRELCEYCGSLAGGQNDNDHAQCEERLANDAGNKVNVKKEAGL